MKYYIHNKSGRYFQDFETFNAAWDFIEAWIPREAHTELYVVGEK